MTYSISGQGVIVGSMTGHCRFYDSAGTCLLDFIYFLKKKNALNQFSGNLGENTIQIYYASLSKTSLSLMLGSQTIMFEQSLIIIKLILREELARMDIF